MILDEKNMQSPPPPYLSAPPPFSARPKQNLNFHFLPSHILLQIVYSSFPPATSQEHHRKTLYWLATSLRLVNRALYIACMHVLRSTYLPPYDSLIRPPYSSDPFPLISPAPPPHSPPLSPYGPAPAPAPSGLQTIQRETATLDLFIALKVREDVWADDSELHLERDESFKDLFDLIQPRSRLEDLVRVYGLREGVITLDSTPAPRVSRNTNASAGSSSRRHVAPPPPSPSSSGLLSVFSAFSSKSKSRCTPIPYTEPPSPRAQSTRGTTPLQSTGINPLPFPLISISFSPRKVGLVLLPSRRTIVETQRTKDETLEKAAKRLVRELKVWLGEGGRG